MPALLLLALVLALVVALGVRGALLGAGPEHLLGQLRQVVDREVAAVLRVGVGEPGPLGCHPGEHACCLGPVAVVDIALVLLGLGLLAFGGWSYLMWGIFFRVTFNLHSTWLVNSATHMWGTRRFVTRDDSGNNWWVALLTFGEGWHNNHHAHPTAARHGLAWYEIDVNYYVIWLLGKLGLATNIHAEKPVSVSKTAAH